MFKVSGACIVSVVVLLVTVPAGGQSARDWDAEAVEKSVKKAKAYLWSKWSDGHWPEHGKPGLKVFPKDAKARRYKINYGGITALCTYALLAAGEKPQEERMARTLKWLAECDTHGTYARALRANVWGMLGRNNKYRTNLDEDVKWLRKAMDSQGAYSYDKGKRDKKGRRVGSGDNSNNQLAVLGVWAGKRNGVEVPLKYWRTVEGYWKDRQNPDGGWCYGRKQSSYGAMSTAGLATMFICFDALYYKEFRKCKVRKKGYDPVVRGLEWMDRNFSAVENPGKGMHSYYYYLYGVERVGLASGYKYFGKKNWYKLGTANLVKKQGADGRWSGLSQTSFALLFLARGQQPVLFNKLKYPGSWNCRPRDLANLTRWISRTFERELNWQIIHLGTPVAEWHDAPILYISGATAPKFTDKDIEALREFVHQGGVIFSEAACSKGAFNMAMQRCYAKMFPQYELARLDRDHPVYNVHFKIRRRGLMGVSNGVRLLAVHSPAEVSLAWQMNAYATKKDIFCLGANIYFYATDKGSLRNRGVSPWPTAKTFRSRKSLKVAIVKYTGNYNPEPLAWKRFSILMGNRYGISVDVSEPKAITQLDASKRPVAAMTGTTAFSLTDEERQALRKYIDAGGTLVVDSAGGSKAFSEAAEKELRKVLPEVEFGPIPSGHAIYTRSGSVIEKVSYRRSLRASVADARKPRLRGVLYKGRFAIIFSRDDLTAGLLGYPCWGLRGYEPDSAFELMRNILLYAHTGRLSGKTSQ